MFLEDEESSPGSTSGTMAFAVPDRTELRLVAIISHLNSCQALINDLTCHPSRALFVKRVQNQQDTTSVEKSFRQGSRMVPIENGDLGQWSPEATVTVTSNDDEDEPDQLVGLDLTSRCSVSNSGSSVIAFPVAPHSCTAFLRDPWG
uniref:Uncharacterized protein n=1 Tax=Anopheles melas TaxID=34690 RepID=A0A182U349_9DIPT